MFKEIIIKDYVIEEFKSYADKNPIEVCGFVTGKCFADSPVNVAYGNELMMVDNISTKAKEVDYVMQPQQMMNVMRETSFIDKKSKVDLIACIHSHPNGLPIPSSIDINRAEYDWVYLIYAPKIDDVKAYTYDHQNKEFYEITMHVQK